MYEDSDLQRIYIEEYFEGHIRNKNIQFTSSDVAFEDFQITY